MAGTGKKSYDYVTKLIEDKKKAKAKAAEGTTASKQSKLDKQIKNKKTRLAAGGVDVDKATDNRNFLEKALGLPEDQNIIFDAFELLGRPQQALFGAWEAAQKGEDVGKAAWEHFKGDDETNFKDVLKNYGMKDEKGKLNLVDVLGFTGDVLLDPADLALIPVTGGASLAVNAADTAGDVAKGAKALDTAKDVAKTTQLKSLSDLAFEGAFKGIKGGAKITDKGIEKALKYLDETKGVGKGADITKLVYKTPEATKAANLGKQAIIDTLDNGTKILDNTNKVGRFELYKDLKDTFTSLFNRSKSVSGDIVNTLNKNNAESYKAAIELQPIAQKIDNTLTSYADELVSKGFNQTDNVEDIVKKVDKDISNLKEYMNFDRNTTVKGILKDAFNGTLSEKSIGEKGIKALQDVADDVNKAEKGFQLTIDVTKDGKVKLSDDWKNFLDPKQRQATQGLSLDPEKLSKKFTKKADYSEADEELLKQLKNSYNKGLSDIEKGIDSADALFAKAYNDVDNVFNEANAIVNKHFGTDLPTTGNAGYVRHAYDKDFYESAKKQGWVTPYGDTYVKGDTGVLQDRLYNMSAREANSLVKANAMKNYDKLSEQGKAYVDKLMGKDGMFKEGVRASFDDYLANIPALAKDSKNIDSIIVKKSFGDYKELSELDKAIKKATDAGDNNLVNELVSQRTQKLNDTTMKILTNSDSTVPRGFKQLSKGEADRLVNKLDKLGKELGNKDFTDTAKYIRTHGDKMAIDNEVLRLVGISTDNKNTNAFVDLYDKYLSFFKKNKVLSPTFQMNNVVGNMSNMYLAGISPAKQATLYPEAMNIMSKGNDVMTKAIRDGVEALTEDEKNIYKIWNDFTNAGFGNANKLTALNLQDMPDSLKKYFDGSANFKDMDNWTKVKDFLPYMNNKANEYVDTASRLVTFMEGSRNSKFLRNLGVESAADAVRKVNFDPSDLTQFEQKFMKRIMPFYTFSKKNLAFQIDNLSRNGSKYNKLFKAQDSLLENATGGNEENVAEWMRNNMYIPFPSLGEDGSYRIFRATLPVGNLIEFTDSPLDTLTGLLSPAIKSPIELKGNTNTFTGLPIENFEGEMSKNLPFLSKKEEYLLSNLTGLDVPLKTGTRVYQGIADTMSSGGSPLEALRSGIVNSTTLQGNTETDKLNKMYEDLDELETLLKKYEQKGYNFSTINELKRANNYNKLDEINAIYGKIHGISSKNPYSATDENFTTDDLYRLYGIE